MLCCSLIEYQCVCVWAHFIGKRTLVTKGADHYIRSFQQIASSNSAIENKRVALVAHCVEQLSHSGQRSIKENHRFNEADVSCIVIAWRSLADALPEALMRTSISFAPVLLFAEEYSTVTFEYGLLASHKSLKDKRKNISSLFLSHSLSPSNIFLSIL